MQNSMLPREVALFMLMLLAWPSATIGQDVVVLKSDDGKMTKRNGIIVDWKGNELSLKTRTRTRQIDAQRILDINTNWPAELLTARKLMQQGKFRQALPELKRASENESRPWVLQIISAERVQCLDATDQTDEALLEFLRLYKQDSQTRFFELIPLPWLLAKPYPAEARFGRKLLESKNALLALISSSLMLVGSHRDEARQRLEQLATDSDSRIAQLATTQLWRDEWLQANDQTLQRWSRQITSLPAGLRAGPLVVLAQAYDRTGDPDSAMINFMKLPILHPEKKSLSALALFRSSEILQDRGQKKLAASLRQELLRNYPTSQFAERARQK